jgi:hypothetical protein
MADSTINEVWGAGHAAERRAAAVEKVRIEIPPFGGLVVHVQSTLDRTVGTAVFGRILNNNEPSSIRR